VQVASQTDKPYGIFMGLETPAAILRPTTLGLSTVNCELAQILPVSGSLAVLATPLTGNAAPPIVAGACQTNASSTTVIVASASGTSGYFVGGSIWVIEFGKDRRLSQRVITASTYGGGNYTFTIDYPFGAPILGLNPPAALVATAGNTATVVGFSAGNYGVKLNATNPNQLISTAWADVTGGYTRIEDVDLTQSLAFVSFPNLF
jgi:hypothetical protein